MSIPTIKVYGENGEIGATYHLLSLEVNHQINKIPSARLIYIDADGYAGKTNISQDKAFKPGTSIKIDLQHDSKCKTIFKGLIIQHRIKYNNKCASLVLELRHAALNLTTSRNNSVFINQSDKEIFNKIGEKYTTIDFNADNIAPSPTQPLMQHKQMIQAWCSDWDFILSRAESNGWWLICGIEGEHNQLRLIDPNKINNPVAILDLNAGNIISAIDLCIDIENQVDKISAVSWNVDIQDIAIGTSLDIQPLPKEKQKFEKLINSTSYNLYHPGDIDKEELTTWALGRKTKNDFSLFRGKIKLAGRLDIDIGTQVDFNNLGRYFNGRHVICSVRYLIGEDGFQTEVGIGIPVDGLFAMQNAEPLSAGAMLPAIKGLYIGVVKGYAAEGDKNNQLLVKVELPFFDQDGDKGVWGRLTSIYAGAGRGIVFRPEIGDEVVLGFFNDDPRYPVILGSMHSAKNEPPIPFTEANNEKGIIINNKNITILLDDEKKSIVLKTSEDKKILSSVEIDNKGISCSSQTVTITASKVEVK